MIKTPLQYSPGLVIQGLEQGLVIKKGETILIAGERLVVKGIFCSFNKVTEQQTFVVRLSDDSFIYYIPGQESHSGLRLSKTAMLAFAELVSLSCNDLMAPDGFVNDSHAIMFDTALTYNPEDLEP